MNKKSWLQGEDGRDGSLSNFLNALPESEQDATAFFLGKVGFFFSYGEDFTMAIALIRHMEVQENFMRTLGQPTRLESSYKQIAARDAVMSLYHFGNALNSLTADAKHIPSVQDALPTLRSAKKILDERHSQKFRTTIRDAVSHRWEFLKSMDHYKSIAVNGHLRLGKLVGRTFEITNKKAHLQLSLTDDEANFIDKLRLQVQTAFPMFEVANSLQAKPSE